jgi:hypothetical protein
VYRGVWFKTADFQPASSASAEVPEFWFYEHTSYPWETPIYAKSGTRPERPVNSSTPRR